MRLGVDIGGTHTDFVLFDPDSGALAVHKVASTPDDPSRAVLEGLAGCLGPGVSPAALAFFSHGTTVTTNALLEGRGAPTALLVTAGFRAIQEVQSQSRDGSPFEHLFQKPAPLAPQGLTWEIPERVDANGDVVQPLDEGAVEAAALALRRQGVQAAAVCYLFSFLRPDHERRTAEIVARVHPDCLVSLSSEVLPRLREWPRMSTTLLDAYLGPPLVRYVGAMERGLRSAGVRTPQLFLMQSSGGVAPFAAAAEGRCTVHTLLSGPAAGVRAAVRLGAAAGLSEVLSLDMGGTSCDVAFIEGGQPHEVTEGTVDRREVWVPMLDVESIGAGGGTVAWLDAAGSLRLGPRSAGAVPGPACYGRGGREPTVTDADLALGWLDPDYFLGGARLDVAAARAALESVGAPLGLDAVAAAAGIARLVNGRLADLIRVKAARRGLDLGRFTLMAFGGAGPVHAARVAEELRLGRVVVPPHPGAFSALGLLCSDVIHDYVRSDLRPLADLAPQDLLAGFGSLETRARDQLAAEGLPAAEARWQRELDMRYAGQGYELRVPLPAWPPGDSHPGDIADAFHRLHQRLHGHRAEGAGIEVVSYRLRVSLPVPQFTPQPLPAGDGGHRAQREEAGPAPAPVVHRVARFASGPADAAVYHRGTLAAGARLEGPALVEQVDATTVVPPGWSCTVDELGNLVLEPAGAGGDGARADSARADGAGHGPGRDATRLQGRDATRLQACDATRTAERDTARTAERDAARTAERDTARLPGRDAARLSGRDAARLPQRDAEWLQACDATRTAERDTARLPGCDATRTAERDTARLPGRDAARLPEEAPSRGRARRPGAATGGERP